MRKSACAECSTEVAAGATYRVADKTPLCEPCANSALQRLGLKKVPPGTVVRHADPTICTRCHTDWGNVELPKISGSPLCAQCTAYVRNFPFPKWVKASFAALAVVVVADAAINARYVIALRELKQGARFARSGKIDDAADQFEAAARHVDMPEMQMNAVAFRGVALMNHDHSAEAEKLLEAHPAPAGQSELYDNALLMAKMGAAFDRHDYDAFLVHAQAILQKDPDSARAIGGVASAYACKYAVSGDEQFRAQSLELLERAKKAPHQDADFQEYEARIRHRLASREIITAAEYHRRFDHHLDKGAH